MKILFLDHDGVICLSNNWGSRHKKKGYFTRRQGDSIGTVDVLSRFDNFDRKAIKVLNEVLIQTGAEIVVSSDWKLYATVEEMGEYYLSQGIIKQPIGFTKRLHECEYPEDFQWIRQWDLEQTRSIEIKQWIKEHDNITHWVAVDDLNMGKTGLYYSMEFEHEWGLDNFVQTPLSNEGIKQTGIKEKIKKYLL
jgi:glycogen synthase